MSDWEKRRTGAYLIRGSGYRIQVNKRRDRPTGWVWVLERLVGDGHVLLEMANGKAPTLAAGKRLGLAAMVAYRRHG